MQHEAHGGLMCPLCCQVPGCPTHDAIPIHTAVFGNVTIPLRYAKEEWTDMCTNTKPDGRQCRLVAGHVGNHHDSLLNESWDA